MSCDIGKATEGLENELWRRAHSPTFPSLHLRHNSFSNPSVALPTSQLILQSFRHFTYVAAHSPTLPSLQLRHSSFSNPSVASPTSQLILQPFFRSSYVTGSSLTSPGEPPMFFCKLNIPSLNSRLLQLINHIKKSVMSKPSEGEVGGVSSLNFLLNRKHSTPL